MGAVGGDVSALRGFVATLTSRARKIEQTKNRLTVTLRDLPWVGPDRDRFLSEWNEIHHPSMIRLIDDLRDAAGRAAHHADAQENASRA